MGNSDPSDSSITRPATVRVTVDAEGRRAAATALTQCQDLLAVVPAPADDRGRHDHRGIVQQLVGQLEANPSLAMAVQAAQGAPGTKPTGPRLGGAGAGDRARLLQQLLRRLRMAEQSVPAPAPVVVLRAAAVRSVGGFDPSFPGLGWHDLAQRLRKSGFGVAGVPEGLPFVEQLHGGLTVAEQCRSEGLWLTRHRPGNAKAVSAADYRRSLLLAARLAKGRGFGGHHLESILSEARSNWTGPAPHEAQTGIGHRADWRFLLAGASHHSLIVFLTEGDRRGSMDAWQWLIEDGWTERIELSVGEKSAEKPHEQPMDADVVFVGLGIGSSALATALRSVGQGGSAVVEQGRSPMERTKTVRRLRADHRFQSVSQYLVTPNLADAKRYVPLDDERGLKWLLASPPPLAASIMTDDLTRGRVGNRFRRLAVAVGAAVASGPAGTAAASALGEGLIIARGQADESADELPGWPLVLMTSGHDEGSRAILAPFADGNDAPSSVVKIASRPAYNGNVDAEVGRITALRRQIAGGGAGSGQDFMPDVGEPYDVGELRASRESYAGRWTASDLCNRVPATRVDVLQRVTDTIDQFALATIADDVKWSPATFDQLIGDLFDRYEELVGHDPLQRTLRTELRERSDQLSGMTLPLVQRHYDIGPWNVVFGDRNRNKPITVIDWELGPPRSPDAPGPAGADQIYFVKYWLHLAMQTRSIDEELTAFEFLAANSAAADPRTIAAAVLQRSMHNLGVNTAAVPLLTVHLWLETALHTIERRRASGIQPGSAALYLDTLARYSRRMLEFWPTTDLSG